MLADAPALLVDYGGVLTNSVVNVLADFCSAHGLEHDAFTSLQTADGPRREHFHAYERGEIEADEFLPAVAGWLGIRRDQLDNMLDGLAPDLKMFAAIDELRRLGVVTCLLSNSWGTASYPISELEATFDEIVISEQVGMRKPEPRIYEHAAALVGRATADCVFLDDTAANVVAAKELGMTGVLVTGRVPLLKRLEEIYRCDLAAFY